MRRAGDLGRSKEGEERGEKGGSAYHFLLRLDRLEKAHNVRVLQRAHNLHLPLQQPELLLAAALPEEEG